MTVLPCPPGAAPTTRPGHGAPRPAEAAAGFADLLDQAATTPADPVRTTDPLPVDLAPDAPAVPVAVTPVVPALPVLTSGAPATPDAPVLQDGRPAAAPEPGPAPQLRASGPAHHGRVPVAELTPAGPVATLAGGPVRPPLHVPVGTPVVERPAPEVLHSAAPVALALPARPLTPGGADPGTPAVLRLAAAPAHPHPLADASPMTPVGAPPPPVDTPPVLHVTVAPEHPHPTADAVAPTPTGPPTPPTSTPAAPPPTPLAPALGALARQSLHTGTPTRVVLRLDPPELGSVQVTLSVRSHGVHVQLVADDAAAAGALSARRAEVRTALESLGLDLSGWDVSGGDPGQPRPDDQAATFAGADDDGRSPGREPRSPYRREHAHARAEAVAYARRHEQPAPSSGVFL